MDERVASEPTLVRGRALLIQGLIRVTHQFKSLALTQGFSSCQWVLGMDPNGRRPHSAHNLSFVILDPMLNDTHFSRTHGAANSSHDHACQCRIISSSPSSFVATPNSPWKLRMVSAVSMEERWCWKNPKTVRWRGPATVVQKEPNSECLFTTRLWFVAAPFK